MNVNKNSNPGPKWSISPLVYIMLFTGLALLVGVIVFAVTLSFLQRPQSSNNTTTTTPAISVPIGTVQPSKTGPYGFSIFRTLTPDTVSYFKELGVTWVRFQLNWSVIEPQQGQFDWSTLDSAVAVANASGIHIDFPLQLAPDWAKSQKCGNTSLLPGPHEMTQYATAVAQRYNGHNGQGHIDSYEIGNEEFDAHLPRNKNIVAQNCSQVNFIDVRRAETPVIHA